MAKVAAGSIPEKVCFVFSDEKDEPIGSPWEIDHYDHLETKKTLKEKVIPTTIIEYGDEKALQDTVAQIERVYYGSTVKPKATVEVLDNLPITNVRLLNTNNYINSYRALIGKHLINLDGDVLMDVLLQTGVAPGAILQGEFIWAKMKPGMKLVRVDSELHRLIQEFESKKDLRPVGKRDLELGSIYQDKKKKKAIFLGYVNTTAYVHNYSAKDFNFEKKFHKKSMLFFQIREFEDLEKNLQKMIEANSSYDFKIKKAHTYIEKIGKVEVPDDLIESIRAKFYKEIREKVVEFSQNKMSAGSLRSNISWTSEFINLYPFNGKEVEAFDVKKLLLFS